ncbi:hypothetical protein D3C71_1714740 [compost metagenome]
MSYTWRVRTRLRGMMMESCGSEYTAWSATSFILSPLISMSCAVSGCSGPTGRKRSFENLLSDRKYLPSASLVSPIEVKPCPGWYITSRRSTTGLAVLSPLKDLMAASTFHLTIWLSRNSVV